MRDPKFVNKDGSFTPYAFACGYVQSWYTGEHFAGSEKSVTLEMQHGVYFVKSFDLSKQGNGLNQWNDLRGWRSLETFTSLTEAKKGFRIKVRELKKV